MNPPKVLIVEDNNVMRNLLADEFLESGYQVITAADGEEGLKMAITQKPNLIFTDFNMPGKNGLEMLVELSAHADFPKIMMHSLHSKSTFWVKDCYNVIPGFNYIEKGTSSDEIITMANKLMGYSKKK